MKTTKISYSQSYPQFPQLEKERDD